MKTCRHCHKSKKENEYSPNKRQPDGLNSACTQCCDEYKQKMRDKKEAVPGSLANIQKQARIPKKKQKAYEAIKADVDHSAGPDKTVITKVRRKGGFSGKSTPDVKLKPDDIKERKAKEKYKPIAAQSLKDLPKEYWLMEWVGSLSAGAEYFIEKLGKIQHVYLCFGRYFIQSFKKVTEVIS